MMMKMRALLRNKLVWILALGVTGALAATAIAAAAPAISLDTTPPDGHFESTCDTCHEIIAPDPAPSTVPADDADEADEADVDDADEADEADVDDEDMDDADEADVDDEDMDEADVDDEDMDEADEADVDDEDMDDADEAPASLPVAPSGD